MAGRKPAEAVRNFLDPLQQAASCVTTSVFRPSHDGYSAGIGHALLLNRGDPIRLGAGLMLAAQLEYDVVRLDNPPPEADGPWKVRTRAYRYHVMTEDLCEVLLWHWHPGGNSKFIDPHLHLGSTQLDTTAVMRSARHLPTGRIAFEQVLMQLINEFDITTQRTDWQEVLESTFERFARWRTWP